MLAYPVAPTDSRTDADASVPPLEPVTSDLFRAAFRNHPAGVAVVTADVGDGPVAMTLSSIASFSADPPMLVFSATRAASSTPSLSRAHTVVVHFVSARQLWLARLGATSGVDRFKDVAWGRLPTGEPVYADATAWVRGRVATKMEAGSSVLFILEVLEVRIADAERDDAATADNPLIYHNRTWHVLSDESVAPD